MQEKQPVRSLDNPGQAPLSARYELLEKIGEGGMATVVKARQLATGRIFAIKLLSIQFTSDEGKRQRFEQEAKSASNFFHPNLVSITDYGVDEQLGPYLVMEYIPGVGLDQILHKQKRLQPHELIAVFSQICKGLSHVHSKGVIHRDLKPSNVMVVIDEAGDLQVKIVDFGIAKEQSAQSITQTGELIGSPLYMSPEQALAGKKVDHRSDIYSVGCMLYEAATGEPPFVGEGALESLVMRLSQDPRRFSEAAPFACLSNELENVVRKAMQRDPQERYQTMAELAVDLRELERTHPTPVEVTEGLKTLRVSAPMQEAPQIKEKVRWVEMAALAAFIVLLAGGLILFGWLSTKALKQAATPPPIVTPPQAVKAPLAVTPVTVRAAAPVRVAEPVPISPPTHVADHEPDAPQIQIEAPPPIRASWGEIQPLIESGRHREALDRCNNLISQLNSQGFQLNPLTAEIHCATAQQAAALNDITSAKSHLAIAIDIFRTHKMNDRLGQTLFGLGLLEFATKQNAKAKPLLAEAERILQPIEPAKAAQAKAYLHEIETAPRENQ